MDDEFEAQPLPTCAEPSVVNRIDTSTSPTIHMFYSHHPIKLTCDSGATSSLIRYDLALELGMKILPTKHSANQADGKTKMTTKGEVQVTLTRNDMKFPLTALVVKELDCYILAGVPFMRQNGIVLDLPNDHIIIGGKYRIPYKISPAQENKFSIKRSQSFVAKARHQHVLYPGEYVELQSPLVEENVPIAIEPRGESIYNNWIEPTISQCVGGVIRIPNLSSNPVYVPKHQHVAQIHYTSPGTDNESSFPSTAKPHKLQQPELFSSCVSLDPQNQLSIQEKRAFADLNYRYDNVFSTQLGKYNDASGRVRAHINMGPVQPPQTKAHLPSYNSAKMNLLQSKMDELESMGVLARPEDINVKVEYVSPSFLVKKTDDDFRLVTAFNTIGTYAKPLPSKSTATEDILRFLAQYRYIIKTDMTKQFFQLPMERSSLKYLGVVTPFKGLRVYTRAAMGMPGSTEHLDELMSRVLGELLQRGICIKLADDLYTGGDSIDELLENWEQILQCFECNNLRLSAKKTEICPTKCTILGWIWSQGKISVSSHKVSPLQSAEPPTNIKGLRSWLGAFKHLRVCLPGHAMLLANLESATAGQKSHSKISWTPELLSSFRNAQTALNDLTSITIPKPSDQLIITSDGAVKKGGVGAVLHIIRKTKTLVAGFFSVKLKTHQLRWLPCEVEALGISAAVQHWAPYIVENNHMVQVLTDSRPCVQAQTKLAHGEFSSSARVSTFLSTLSRYKVSLQYIPGTSNISADFLSRNPSDCQEPSCQICKFVRDSEEASVCQIKVTDILEGRSTMPFLTPSTWKSSQQDCPTLRRTYAHLKGGTRPGRKATKVKELKRYLQICSIGKYGMLVVRKDRPFAPAQDLTVIPVHILPGLLSALHLRLQHPTKTQLTKVFNRYFYALDADLHIENITNQCPQCASVAKLPKEIEDFSTGNETLALGTNFACDVLCRARQRIFLLRDSFSSFTVTKLIADEKSPSVKSALIEGTAEIRSPKGCKIRVDGATPLQSLQGDAELTQLGIQIEVGRLKNRNKNPVAEKAIQELEYELKRYKPDGGQITPSDLAIVTSTLNNRVRNRGLSAKEVLLQRDSLTGEQLNFSDDLLASSQHRQRVANHGTSSLSQAKTTHKSAQTKLSTGDLIYIKCEGDKHTARDSYIITSLDDEYVYAQKLRGYQFRSKVYKLKYSEVFKIPSTCPPFPSQTHMPLIHQHDSSDDETLLLTPKRQLCPVTHGAPVLPSEHDMEWSDAQDSVYNHQPNDIDDSVSEDLTSGVQSSNELDNSADRSSDIFGDNIGPMSDHNVHQSESVLPNNVVQSGDESDNSADQSSVTSQEYTNQDGIHDDQLSDSDDKHSEDDKSGSYASSFSGDTDTHASEDVEQDQPYYFSKYSNRRVRKPPHLKDYDCG